MRAFIGKTVSRRANHGQRQDEMKMMIKKSQFQMYRGRERCPITGILLIPTCGVGEKKADAFADELEKTDVTETIFKLQTADSMAFYKLQTVWILSPPQS